MEDIQAFARAYCDEVRATTDRTYECPRCGRSPEMLSIYRGLAFKTFDVNGRCAYWRCVPCRAHVFVRV